jgi:hypothetical protein
MKPITAHRKHLEARCRQRGYKLQDVMSCVIEQNGDQWTVDTEHPAYPRKRAKPTVTAEELEQRKVACLTCKHFVHGKMYCKQHAKKPNGKRCESWAINAYRLALAAEKPWCKPWAHLPARSATSPTGDTRTATPARPETAADLSEAIGRIAGMPAAELEARTNRCREIVDANYLASHMADRKAVDRKPIIQPRMKGKGEGAMETTGELLAPFERAYVINLRRRPDRLKAFFDRLAKADWPVHWPRPEVYEAIDGDQVGTPEEFVHGGGAYGCRMSHLRLLQDCLMHDIKSVMVFEDDAELTPNIGPQLAEFCAAAPDDWEGLMPGGQHHQPPDAVAGSPGVIRIKNAQRTHCYIARGEYLKSLQRRWGCSNIHIDWRMKDFHHKFRVYGPAVDGAPRWLVGQAGGRSDVYKGQKPPEWWNTPNEPQPLIVLHSPREVMEELRNRGFHSGMRRNKDGIDVGLAEAYATANAGQRKSKLKAWVKCLQQECCGGWIVTAWHPQAKLSHFEGLVGGDMIEVTAVSVEEALSQLSETMRTRLERSIAERVTSIVLLDAPRDVFEALRTTGFHAGNWRHEGSGIDNGLRAIYSGTEDPEARAEALKKWCKVLLTEADRDGQVLMAWHPGAVPMGALTAEHLEKAAGRRVVVIKAATAEEARKMWEES